MSKRIYSFFLLFVLVGVSIPIILPYFHQGYFPTHDGEWAVVRLTDMFRILRDHQFPARFSGNLNFGYGYPLFNFAYPLPYYIGTVFHFLRFGFVDSVKLIFAITVPLSAIGMYMCSKELWKNKAGGFISGILYIYLPYRMVDLYVRGSIGESLAFVLFPFIIYFLIKLYKNPQSILSLCLLSISYAALIMTHNIMVIEFSIFVVFLFIFLAKKGGKPVAISIMKGLLGGLGLAAFFWLPALLEKGNILLSIIPIADRSLYFVNTQQLLIPSWGYGVPTDGTNAFTYQLGLAQIGIFLLAISILFLLWKRDKKKLIEFSSSIALLMLGAIVIYLFLLFPASILFWKLPLLKEINYPWTLLASIGFLMSLLAGFVASRNKVFLIISSCLCIMGIIATLPYAKPLYFVDKTDNYYLTNDATTTSSSELMPLWVKSFPSVRPEKKVVPLSPDATIEVTTNKSNKIVFTGEARKPTILQINTVYYPGWKVTVNNQPVDISYKNKNGLMQVVVPTGHIDGVATFSETSLRFVSDVISLITIVILFFLSIRYFLGSKDKSRHK